MRRTDPEHRVNALSGSPGRFAATLLVALVATAPGFRDALSEGGTLPAAVGRFLVAFLVLWVLGSVVAAVLRHGPAEGTHVDVTDMVPGAAGTDQ